MLYIDVEGSNVKLALQKGLKQLNLKEEDVKTEILTQEKKGIFGIGNKQLAKVRIFYKETNEINNFLENIKKIITYIDSNAVCHLEKVEERNYLKIESQIPEQFIGKAGKTHNALQMLINALMQKYNNSLKIIVSINNYSEKKKSNFIKWINNRIKSVSENGKAVILKPMNSFERRIVHLEVKKHPHLKSESRGMTKLKSIKISQINKDADISNHDEDAEKTVLEDQKKFAEEKKRQEN